jgi:nanoRNase/pAp phosphatase (c-di-AMP/oligoRNAs hydrolase)
VTRENAFHFSNITPKTFDISRRTVEAGVNPAAMARRVFDQNSFGKLKLIGALLAEMDLLDNGRLAAMYLNDDIMNATGTTYNDTEGLINLPLTAREIRRWFFAGRTAYHVNTLEVNVDIRSVAAPRRRRSETPPASSAGPPPCAMASCEMAGPSRRRANSRHSRKPSWSWNRCGAAGR